MPIAQKSQPTGLRGGRRSSQAHAPEFGEDLRQKRRDSGAADAPKHLPGMLTLLWNPPVQGVDEQIKELEHRPETRAHTASSTRSARCDLRLGQEERLPSRRLAQE